MRVSFCLLLAACAQKPVLVSTHEHDRAEKDGVAISANTDAWNGSPHDLGRFAVPLAVEITNHRSEPILVRGEDFTLKDRHGWQVRRLVPRRAGDTSVAETDKPDLPQGASSVFRQPTLLQPIFPTEERFAWVKMGNFWIYRGPRIYFEEPIANYGTPEDFYLVAQPAPKNDILPMALDEGVLDPGATRQGFLYFNLPPEHVGELTLRWKVAAIQESSAEPPRKLTTLALHFGNERLMDHAAKVSNVVEQPPKNIRWASRSRCEKKRSLTKSPKPATAGDAITRSTSALSTRSCTSTASRSRARPSRVSLSSIWSPRLCRSVWCRLSSRS